MGGKQIMMDIEITRVRIFAPRRRALLGVMRDGMEKESRYVDFLQGQQQNIKRTLRQAKSVRNRLTSLDWQFQRTEAKHQPDNQPGHQSSLEAHS
jgi:hypothetical protein